MPVNSVVHDVYEVAVEVADGRGPDARRQGLSPPDDRHPFAFQFIGGAVEVLDSEHEEFVASAGVDAPAAQRWLPTPSSSATFAASMRTRALGEPEVAPIPLDDAVKIGDDDRGICIRQRFEPPPAAVAPSPTVAVCMS